MFGVATFVLFMLISCYLVVWVCLLCFVDSCLLVCMGWVGLMCLVLVDLYVC